MNAAAKLRNAGKQYARHDSTRARMRRVRQMARAELRDLRARHGTDVGLDGRTPAGIIVEPVRAQQFDAGVVDLQHHERG